MKNVVIVGTSKSLSYNSNYEVRKLIAGIIKYEGQFEKITVGSGEAIGIDSIVKEITTGLLVEYKPFPPAKDHEHWPFAGECNNPFCYGFKARNLDMAEWGNVGYVIVKKDESAYCYHCKGNHVKSGACWTGQKMKTMGKEVKWFLV